MRFGSSTVLDMYSFRSLHRWLNQLERQVRATKKTGYDFRMSTVGVLFIFFP